MAKLMSILAKTFKVSEVMSGRAQKTSHTKKRKKECRVKKHKILREKKKTSEEMKYEMDVQLICSNCKNWYAFMPTPLQNQANPIVLNIEQQLDRKSVV